jgi:hypothetical protein
MENFNQLCVWPETLVGKENVVEFENYFKEEVNIRIKYVEEIENVDGGNDVFFYVHQEDLKKFLFKRMEMGIKWWEDVEGKSRLYSREVLEKYLD